MSEVIIKKGDLLFISEVIFIEEVVVKHVAITMKYSVTNQISCVLSSKFGAFSESRVHYYQK